MKLILFVVFLVATAAAVPSLLPRNSTVLDGRIVGGSPILISQVPWQISLQRYGSHICGGSIISQEWVLTAAHCTDGASVTSLTVRAGSGLRGYGGVVIQVIRIAQNPRYNSLTIDYDMSLLQLGSDLEFSVNVQPVNLPNPGMTWDVGLNVFVSGWGTLSQGGSSPVQLQGVTLQIISKQLCQNYYDLNHITDRMLCAGVTGGGKDACQGDSGGPLVEPTQKILVGIVSWGIGCALANYPGVYTNVAQPDIWSFISNITTQV